MSLSTHNVAHIHKNLLNQHMYIVILCCYELLGDEKNRIQVLEDELARLKAQMARLTLEQIEKSNSNGNKHTI